MIKEWRGENEIEVWERLRVGKRKEKESRKVVIKKVSVNCKVFKV